MSDEPHDEGVPQPPKVDLRDSANVGFWCQHWNVTVAELGAAIQRVGVSVPAVAFALGKEAY
jgi:hypothetical protein